MKRYTPAVIACLGILFFYVMIGVALGWKHGGGLIPNVLLLAALAGAWRAAMRKASKR